jgi:uncharacterized protein (DUF697 family)/uncharacterized tellurite resistance protein B-like protein
MTDQERQAIMTLVVMAAFADDRNADAERQEVRRIADSLSEDSGLNVAGIYQDVLLKRASLDAAVAALASPETKRLAYELCVGVCDADGTQGDAERSFLSDLQARLGFSAAEAAAAEVFTADAEALAAAPLAVTEPPDLPVVQASRVSAAEQDRMILNYAILNGALELLPDSLATMAIIPLQMKMVYRIGKSYGYELDSGHIKDFLATGGIGMASQYVEQIGIRLLGSLFGKKRLRGMVGSMANQAISSGFSFATTYALGRLAVRYYSGGRTFSTQVLKDTYAGLLGEAKGLQQQYLPAIQERARTVNVSQILQEVRA